MLTIKNLHATVEEAGKGILHGLELEMPAGQVHAIMGPNGAGKSTLGYTLAGRDGYTVTDGDILLEGESVLEMEADERARAGMFLAFQYPVELPGVNTAQFLRTAVNAHRTGRGEPELDALTFLKLARAEMAKLNMSDDFLSRSVNTGFSGGEKKRFEILQMALLQPKLAVLDETDSGLDIDALKIVAEGVNRLRSDGRSFLIITHYQRLLDYIKPDVVHIMAAGKIVKSGGPELAHQLEAEGYETILKGAA
ncbi:MAG: Fe-S cluster assembly ATPase SufC [Alphaproteobacteria bacterium]|nr:MAG: Fe-S cluster assembly ATPase SufC [Alphaproteobacteria bacterium]